MSKLKGLMDNEQESRQELFGNINDLEMKEDIDIAVENYKISEIHEIEEFILGHSGVFKKIKEHKQ